MRRLTRPDKVATPEHLVSTRVRRSPSRDSGIEMADEDDNEAAKLPLGDGCDLSDQRSSK